MSDCIDTEQAAIHGAAQRLRDQGCDVDTIASLFLNGAAALTIERLDEEGFVELARKLWKTTARQVELLALLDRAVAKKEFRVKPRKGRRSNVSKRLREGATS